MIEAESFSKLIGGIYDAALDPDLWPAALHDVADYVGGQSAAIGYINRSTRLVDAHHTSGCDPHYLALYLSRYGRYDPTMNLLLLPTGLAVSTADVMPYDQFREGRFYQEWAQPQGWVDSLGVSLETSCSGAVILSILRNEESGLVDDEARQRMALVLPHVKRAALIGLAVEQRKAAAETLTDTLDGLSAGMFLVDAKGRIVHANASGQAMLAESVPVRAAAGSLATNEGYTERALRTLFDDAARGDAALDSRGIAVPLTGRDGGQYVAHVLPLTSRARRRTGLYHGAAAVVFVRPVSFDAPAASGAMARSYKLTPSELRVLLGIVEVGGAPEVAEALGLADTTVKTHLNHIYLKTGARRHADLVKLIAAYSNPLIG